MKKRDFVQQASIQFMPSTAWDLDKSISYAEKLWLKLEQRGYGDSKPHAPKKMVNYYQQLSTPQKTQFDQFWIAFDYKHGKQRAAMRWSQMEQSSTAQLNKIIKAAKQTAAARKNLNKGQTPIMAEGWLTDLRFDDCDTTEAETQQKQNNQHAANMREITSKLNHAKSMAEATEDDFWQTEVERLTQTLKQARNQHEQ